MNAQPKLSEHAFQRWIIETARHFGWSCWHIPAPMRYARGAFVGAKEGAGVADLILIHDDPPRLVFAEIKREGGKLSEKQREILQAVRNVGDYISQQLNMLTAEFQPSAIGVYVWTPDDAQPIEDLLRSRVLS